ncbi:Lrp/AsnC family transcriptional regulator [Streptomyces milbemycinicus]|uniref:Lrp/AsnC family transcriptional regulator n=1 Tax=Streptomyces milbemycinicus TaxID=476552 RepID=UPI0033CEAD18
MADGSVRDTYTLDEVDRGLIHALHLDGRAPFSRIAAVLGVSTQTVARRYRRLRIEAGLRVVGLPDPHRAGQAQWLVRIAATPADAQALARSLARRPDTSWVKLASGGAEIVTVVHAPRGADASRSMLLRDIPRTAGITAVSAHLLLHTYLGGPTAWRGHLGALSDEQQRRLVPPTAPPPEADPSPASPPTSPLAQADRALTEADRALTEADRALTEADRALLDALRQDGRTSHADLAAATGWSPATVARRLTGLREYGTLFFDVEFDDALLGVTTQALLWMAVAPARLDEIATALARHAELAVVAATTGPTNLVAHALCSDPAALHHYLTRHLGSLNAIRTLETAPVLHTLKATGTPRGPRRPRTGAGTPTE